jgi:hypothetical protein
MSQSMVFRCKTLTSNHLKKFIFDTLLWVWGAESHPGTQVSYRPGQYLWAKSQVRKNFAVLWHFLFSHFQDYLIHYISHQYQDLLYCNSSQYILSTVNSQHNNNNNVLLAMTMPYSGQGWRHSALPFTCTSNPQQGVKYQQNIVWTYITEEIYRNHNNVICYSYWTKLRVYQEIFLIGT